MTKLSEFVFIPKERLSGFTFIQKEKSKIVQTPTFIEGELADAIYQKYKAEKARLNNNPSFQLNKEERTITGSNIFDSALINQIIKPYGLRTVLPQDLTKEVLDMVKDKHYYVDTNAIVLSSINDKTYPANNSLAATLAELIGYKESKGPVLITSLGVRVELFPEDEDYKDYGLRLITSDKSKLIYDDRLSKKYNGLKFNTIDELGLPKDLNRNKGWLTWYRRNKGLSGLSFSRVIPQRSGEVRDRLDFSSSRGRVVLVSDETSTQKNP